MIRSLQYSVAALTLWLAAPLSAQASGPVDPMATLLAQDVRLAVIAERLMQANGPLCRQTMPLAGFLIHSSDQYASAEAGRAFANGPVAISAVLPGTAAAAEMRAGDGLAAIGTRPTADLRAEAEAPLRDSVFAVLADQPTGRPLSLTVLRDGSERAVTLPAVPGCRALVEVRSEPGHDARTDGRVVQVNFGLVSTVTDDQLAVVFAHELAHLVLEHRRRLEAAGVVKGFFGEFGKNQRPNRQVEVEADRLSVHLLANAGFDPAIAPAFWRSSPGRRGSILLLSSTYPTPEARAQLIEREIADYLGAGAGPTWPGHLLARRDRAFQ